MAGEFQKSLDATCDANSSRAGTCCQLAEYRFYCIQVVNGFLKTQIELLMWKSSKLVYTYFQCLFFAQERGRLKEATKTSSDKADDSNNSTPTFKGIVNA